MKRFTAVVLAMSLIVTALFCVNVKADTSDLIRFLPTEIEVNTDEVIVHGYFVNMNKNVTVKNFTEFEMYVYHDGELLVDGDFGTINEFSVRPLGMKYQSFRFTGDHDLPLKDITCDDLYYVSFACSYTTVSN